MRIQKILVTGANGQLGWALSQAAKVTPNFEYIFLDRHAMDLSIPSELERIVELFAPSAIINAAAYTAVDKAETETKLAHTINAEAVAVFASIAKNKNIPLFSANLLLALTKNLKFCYINLDSLLYDAPANIKNHKMVMFDKIYG
jgi:nucleoside-diphosphate-sugar epimerase